MAAREMSGTRPWDASSASTAEQMDVDASGDEATSGTATAMEVSAGGLGHLSDKRELFRSGSMNLPKPEDSGVPAVHPDMCILRIRRNHLVEVRRHFSLAWSAYHSTRPAHLLLFMAHAGQEFCKQANARA